MDYLDPIKKYIMGVERSLNDALTCMDVDDGPNARSYVEEAKCGMSHITTEVERIEALDEEEVASNTRGS